MEIKTVQLVKKRIRNITLIIILTLGSQKIFCQKKFSDYADIKVSTLKKNNVDTIITYHNYFESNTNRIYKKGDTNYRTTDVLLVFWVKNGQFFKQRFDDCNDHQVQKLSQSPFIKLSCDSLNAIKINQVEPVTYNYKDENGNPVYTVMTVSHSELTRFTFFFNKTEFAKNIDHFNLETEKSEDGHINENYQQNQKSILKRLIDIVTKEL